MKIAMTLVFCLMAAACGADDLDDPGEFATATGAGFPTLEIGPDFFEEVLDAGAAGVCQCATAACLAAWVEEHIGCDVCVVLGCSPSVGVCTFCERELDPALEREERPAPTERPALFEP
jgi:hypothetical protein